MLPPPIIIAMFMTVCVTVLNEWLKRPPNRFPAPHNLPKCPHPWCSDPWCLNAPHTPSSSASVNSRISHVSLMISSLHTQIRLQISRSPGFQHSKKVGQVLSTALWAIAKRDTSKPNPLGDTPFCPRTIPETMSCPLHSRKSSPGILWIAEDFGCCASGSC